MAKKINKTCTIIVPVYNEQESINKFVDVTSKVLDSVKNIDWNILFIDDGSTDLSLSIIRKIHKKNKKIQALSLSRNFGQINALCCGIEHAKSDVAIIIDVDLQQPPELIPKMLDLWHKGNDMIVPLIKKRKYKGRFFYKIFAKCFYSIVNKLEDISIPQGGSQFRLLDKKIINALRDLKEKNRFMMGLYAYPGFKTTHVYYTNQKRYAGKTKWNYFKYVKYALDGIFGFSSFALKIWTLLGIIIVAISFIYSIKVFYDALVLGNRIRGIPTIILLLLFFNGLIMINLGIIGEYVSRIFIETKQRPLYFVDKKIGIK